MMMDVYPAGIALGQQAMGVAPTTAAAAPDRIKWRRSIGIGGLPTGERFGLFLAARNFPAVSRKRRHGSLPEHPQMPTSRKKSVPKRAQGRPKGDRNNVGREALLVAACKYLATTSPSKINQLEIARAAGSTPRSFATTSEAKMNSSPRRSSKSHASFGSSLLSRWSGQPTNPRAFACGPWFVRSSMSW